MESGVRKHCKFERRPVQETVFQLTDTDHLIYSPILQTSTITCKNGTQQTVYIEQATKITLSEGCTLKLNKHTIHSNSRARLTPHPLQYAWHWDPLSLPSTLLADPEHLDHLIYELQTHINKIDNTTLESEDFEAMLVKNTFSTNPTALIIWTGLFLSTIANFTLFCIAVYCYYKHRHNKTEYQQQQPTNPEYQDIINEVQKLLRERTAHHRAVQFQP
jgi:large-conductance mechanosensitive channel